MNAVAQMTIDALRQQHDESLPRYEEALTEACQHHPPPFGAAWYGERYRRFAMEPQWMTRSLVANAFKEADGSRTLWKLAGSIADPNAARQVRDHAIDESRHAQIYVAMLHLAFPDAVDVETRNALDEISPGYTSHDAVEESSPKDWALVLDEIIQMNIGEIRTRIHQFLMRPVLHEWCPPESRDRLNRTLDSLLVDETRHICYTAKIIDEAAAHGQEDFVRRTMGRRVEDFNALTLKEVGGSPETVFS